MAKGARACTHDLFGFEQWGIFTGLCFARSNTRAVISIVSNIAEGFERDGNAEFIQLLSVAKGSAGEVRAQLYAALDCRYINSEEFNKLCACK